MALNLRESALSEEADIRLKEEEIVFLRTKKMEVEEKITFAQKQKSEEEKSQRLKSELEKIQNRFFHLTAEMPQLIYKEETHQKNIYALKKKKYKLLRTLRIERNKKKILQNQEMEIQDFPEKLRKAEKEYENQYKKMIALQKYFFTLAMLYNPQPCYILYPCCCDIFAPPPPACYAAPYPYFFHYASPSDKPMPPAKFSYRQQLLSKIR